MGNSSYFRFDDDDKTKYNNDVECIRPENRHEVDTRYSSLMLANEDTESNAHYTPVNNQPINQQVVDPSRT